MRVSDDQHASQVLAFLFLMPSDDLAVMRSLGVPPVLVDVIDLADRFREQCILFFRGGEVVLDSGPSSALVSVAAEPQ